MEETESIPFYGRLCLSEQRGDCLSPQLFPGPSVSLSDFVRSKEAGLTPTSPIRRAQTIHSPGNTQHAYNLRTPEEEAGGS